MNFFIRRNFLFNIKERKNIIQTTCKIKTISTSSNTFSNTYNNNPSSLSQSQLLNSNDKVYSGINVWGNIWIRFENGSYFYLNKDGSHYYRGPEGIYFNNGEGFSICYEY
ncbi:hypothetical protein GLOIN_2v1885096 [Rhizophagus clarus]|uniref:Uncharacterized protein n=1 Tax=Rhizophagus clarus TaxID=94130 RepID=A0A8H3QWJ5_9GLOM|nr:hypothetical protein GLOIN_2v1885096 [Rhizophagus clarus]